MKQNASDGHCGPEKMLLLGSVEYGSVYDFSVPSHTNIVSSFLGPARDPTIEMGDNIVIYFSGHGSCYSPSDLDHTAEIGSIEALCPMDREDLDADGVPIADISDREINSILKEVSRNKGNHITFILDCCHPGSLSPPYRSQSGVLLKIPKT
ncbi:hypothetical protein DFS33DRAFT_1452154 [Desarmillaria ectypa]|nr:hypothetical protein DFS33DRAFT_1452154 [Desarmillaria ectypa]